MANFTMLTTQMPSLACMCTFNLLEKFAIMSCIHVYMYDKASEKADSGWLSNTKKDRLGLIVSN